MIKKSVFLSAVLSSSVLLLGSTVQPLSRVHGMVPAPAALHRPDDVSSSLYRYLPPEEYRELVEWYCREQGLYVDMVCRLIWEESKWDPAAENTGGLERGLGVDRGLFQINSRNWRSWCMLYNGGVVADPFDAEANLRVGIRAFGAYVREHKYRPAYIRWNAGLGRLDSPPRTTVSYVRRILAD